MANYRYYIRRNFKSESMEDFEVKNAIFKKGLREAFFEEIEYNKENARKIIKRVHDLYPYKPEDRKFIAFIPFRIETWKALVNSGLLSLIKERQKEFLNVYNLIFETNYLIELQKQGYGHETIITQIDNVKPKHGIYLPWLIEEKSEEILKKIIQIKNNK